MSMCAAHGKGSQATQTSPHRQHHHSSRLSGEEECKRLSSLSSVHEFLWLSPPGFLPEPFSTALTSLEKENVTDFLLSPSFRSSCGFLLPALFRQWFSLLVAMYRCRRCAQSPLFLLQNSPCPYFPFPGGGTVCWQNHVEWKGLYHECDKTVAHFSCWNTHIICNIYILDYISNIDSEL